MKLPNHSLIESKRNHTMADFVISVNLVALHRCPEN